MWDDTEKAPDGATALVGDPWRFMGFAWSSCGGLSLGGFSVNDVSFAFTENAQSRGGGSVPDGSFEARHEVDLDAEIGSLKWMDGENA
ncbi:hypothetical protein HYFRA_00010862 [Hymenoscyphus fraxineus]|uniref:Uncharacterized protein n=1 Tax=Hymenoscyphus fraxineus TaxID=746836 RepID=A0A9N9PNT3_9HELO|nr:hypothetical protein HYFRA_00010862 [Hymenoscyphus fraxineus]